MRGSPTRTRLVGNPLTVVGTVERYGAVAKVSKDVDKPDTSPAAAEDTAESPELTTGLAEPPITTTDVGTPPMVVGTVAVN